MKYKFSAMAMVSCYTEVEADSLKEAIEEAEDRELGGLCHNAIYPGADEAWHFENDGCPIDIKVDEE